MGLGIELRVEGESNKRIMKKYDSKKRDWLRLAVEIVIVIILVLLVLSLIFGISRVDGQSMEPTLENSQVVSFLRIGNDYDYGDIVAIKMPNGDRYVKRIIGLPGDEIDVYGGYVYRNGSKLNEGYIKGAEGTSEGSEAAGTTYPVGDRIEYPVKVPEGKYWVMGDNREHSKDSRDFGPVIEENIKGRLMFQD